MKKWNRLMTVAAAFALCLSLAGCGKTSGAIQDYIDSAQDQIDQMASELEPSGIQLSVTERNSSLVYTYQFTYDISGVLDEETLLAAIDAQAASASFQETLSALGEMAPSTKSVIIEYLDVDGSVIASQSYKLVS